jgi:hypothetical protein
MGKEWSGFMGKGVEYRVRDKTCEAIPSPKGYG